MVLVHGDTATTFAAPWQPTTNKLRWVMLRQGSEQAIYIHHGLKKPIESLPARLLIIILRPRQVPRKILLNEGVSEDDITVTGNTVIDALFWVREKLKQDKSLSGTLSSTFDYLDPNKKLILVTGHRRESFGGGFERICEALRQIATMHPELKFYIQFILIQMCKSQ